MSFRSPPSPIRIRWGWTPTNRYRTERSLPRTNFAGCRMRSTSCRRAIARRLFSDASRGLRAGKLRREWASPKGRSPSISNWGCTRLPIFISEMRPMQGGVHDVATPAASPAKRHRDRFVRGRLAATPIVLDVECRRPGRLRHLACAIAGAPHCLLAAEICLGKRPTVESAARSDGTAWLVHSCYQDKALRSAHRRGGNFRCVGGNDWLSRSRLRFEARECLRNARGWPRNHRLVGRFAHRIEHKHAPARAH